MKTSFVKTLLTLGMAGLMCAAGKLKAAEIQGVTISAVSSQNWSPPGSVSGQPTYAVTNLVTGCGLFGDAHAFVPGGSMWLATNGLNGTNYVTFNLGQLYTVNAIKVWNYNDVSHINYGVSNAAISYSTDGINFTTNLPSQNFTEAPIPSGWQNYAQTITLSPAISAQYIRFSIKTNWGGGTAGVGLAKVRFISNTNPPTILSATENFGSNQVTIVYSESVNPATATNVANYTLNGATISSITMGEYPDHVILRTSPLSGNYTVAVTNVYDEALTCPVSNAVPVQSEVYLWLQADQGVTTTSAFGGNMVTAWNDQSPYGHNAQPANFFNVYTNGPFLVPNVVNGHAALQFFGTNVLQIPNDPANPINGDMTLFMVVESTSSGTAEDPISKTGGGSNNNSNNLAAPFDFYLDATAGGGKPDFLFGNSGIAGVSIKPTGQTTPNTFYLVACSVTGTNIGQLNLGQMFINGNPPISNINVNPNTQLSWYSEFTAGVQDAGNPIAIGARNDAAAGGAQPFIGYLPEVILIRGTITPSDLANIQNYLAVKYAVAPPTITEQPANTTNNIGSQATFWVAASGMMPFTYQWYSNSVAIAGATGASYTTPYLTASANGAQYTVGITNASGGTNSMAATLGVTTPTAGPTVFSAVRSASLGNVTVLFSEAVDPVTSQSTANYSINNGVIVTAVSPGSSANQVVLTITGMTTNTYYSLTVKNIQDQNSDPMAAVTVPVMPPSMSLWLRADSGVVTNPVTGSIVDAWLDQSGNGNNAVTYGISSAFRPSLTTDSASGRPALNFVAANKNFLVIPSAPDLSIIGDMNMYFVGTFASTNAYREVLAKTTGGNANPWEYNILTGASKMRWSHGDGMASLTGTATSGNGNAAGFLSVWNVYHQGSVPQPGTPNYINGTGSFYFNGVGDGGTAFTLSSYQDIGSPVYVGIRNSFDIEMDGDMSEIMLFTNVLSGWDRTNIDNYVGLKYFPFVTNSLPLTNEMANAGSAATFIFVASQGTAHLTYQWLEMPAGTLNFTNITGANGTSYSTGELLAGDNGDQFEVAVINPGAYTNIIGPVTLTVMSVAPIVTYWATPFWASNNTIIINFQEPVNPSTATNILNYTLHPSGSILSATMWSASQVLLTTTPLTSPPYSVTVSGVQSLLGATITSTNLPNVTANLYPQNVVLWLRPDAGLSGSEGSPVSEWDDQSGNGNDFYGDGSEMDEPTYATNGPNGYPAVQFNATNVTYMYALPAASLALTNDMAIFAVMNFSTYLNGNGATGTGGGGEILSRTLNGVPSTYDYYIYYNPPNVPYFLRGPSSPFVGSGVSPSTGTWHTLGVVMTGLAGSSPMIYHRLDGRQTGSVAWTPIVTLVDNGAGSTYDWIGTREGKPNGVSLTGYMSELLMIGSTLSTNDWDAIETYLGAKYGLLTSPGPLSITRTNSTTATLSWPTPQWSIVLQSTTNLVRPVVWANVPNTVSTVNGTNYVTVGATNSAVFYRLQSQSQ